MKSRVDQVFLADLHPHLRDAEQTTVLSTGIKHQGHRLAEDGSGKVLRRDIDGEVAQFERIDRPINVKSSVPVKAKALVGLLVSPVSTAPITTYSLPLEKFTMEDRVVCFALLTHTPFSGPPTIQVVGTPAKTLPTGNGSVGLGVVMKAWAVPPPPRAIANAAREAKVAFRSVRIKDNP